MGDGPDLDTITPGNPHYSEKSRLAKTIQQDGKTWGKATQTNRKLAHQNSQMTCYTCHSSWLPTCYGCHLPMTANQRMPMLHNEGLTTRTRPLTTSRSCATTCTCWDGWHGDRQSRRAGALRVRRAGEFAKPRSRLAILPAADGLGRRLQRSGIQHVCAPHGAHQETSGCTDCHVSSKGDNNAWLAQVLFQGPKFMNL